MTDIMKLATDYAQACYNLANPDSYDAELAEEARAALQSAIEALQTERDALLDRLEKAEKALKVAANALSLALSDVDWRKDSPTQPVIHKAYQKAMEASK